MNDALALLESSLATDQRAGLLDNVRCMRAI